MTSRPFFCKKGQKGEGEFVHAVAFLNLLGEVHKFKRGLKDKWCISNVSLDNALLAGKFIEIIMLIKLVVIFLLA